MSKLDEFIALLETEARNHSIYVWGAQGQTKPTITEAWIRSRETSATNANRAIAYWKKQIAAGYGDVLKAFDCSGLGIWAMQQLKVISGDMNANGLKGKCAKLTKAQLKRGDWVFRVNSSGRATHIGYIADNDINVIEAYGRDKGVTKNHIDHWGTDYWNWFGRPSYFKADIEGGDLDPDVSKPYIEALGSVNVRDKPSSTGKILGVAKKGDRLPLADSGWHHVILNGKEGYISGQPNLTKRVD